MSWVFYHSNGKLTDNLAGVLLMSEGTPSVVSTSLPSPACRADPFHSSLFHSTRNRGEYMVSLQALDYTAHCWSLCAWRDKNSSVPQNGGEGWVTRAGPSELVTLCSVCAPLPGSHSRREMTRREEPPVSGRAVGHGRWSGDPSPRPPCLADSLANNKDLIVKTLIWRLHWVDR